MDFTEYRKIFRDIVKGKTEVLLQGKKFYIKHLSALDQVDIDDVKKMYYDSAIDRGIPSEAEVLKSLHDEGVWTEEEEKEIENQKAFIGQLQKNKTQLVLKSQIDNQNKMIKETEEKINELNTKKQELMGINAESYSNKRASDYYIIKSFYEDADLKNPLFPEEKDFNELYSEDIHELINTYNESFLNFDELKIQTMILQDFYYIYFPFSDDTVGFFGNPVAKLTYNQLKLIVYTKIFKSIFENNKHIPEGIRKDPQALMDYGSIDEDAKNKLKERMEGGQDGAMLFNATEEDFEYAGLDKPSDSPTMSLQEAAKEKGGSLSMEDLMELSGHRTK